VMAEPILVLRGNSPELSGNLFLLRRLESRFGYRRQSINPPDR
jgi:hypothetical protein